MHAPSAVIHGYREIQSGPTCGGHLCGGERGCEDGRQRNGVARHAQAHAGAQQRLCYQGSVACQKRRRKTARVVRTGSSSDSAPCMTANSAATCARERRCA